MRSKGLGDDIKQITSAVALDKLSEKIAEIIGAKSCGCDTRQEQLNQYPSVFNKISKALK